MPNDQQQDGDLSNSYHSVRGAANHRICAPNTNSGPVNDRVHDCYGSPSATFPVTNAPNPSVSPSGISSSSSSNKKRSHHKRKSKRTRSISNISVQQSSTLSLDSDSATLSSSEPIFRQRTFSRTLASSTLTNISNLTSLASATSPPQVTPVPVQGDVTNWKSNVTAAEDLNPFSTSPPPSHLSSVMFPSFSSAIDAVPEERYSKGIQVEIDSLGCAILPPSEYIFSLESECKFHYSFWDSYNKIHFCIPVDLALRLDPLQASLYDYYPLALPPISHIAVRFSTVTFQTRFSRLVPKPTQPVPTPQSSTPATTSTATTTTTHHHYQLQLNDTTPTLDPKQSFIITYRGAALKCPNAPYKKSEDDKPEITIANGICLSSSWERIVDVDDDDDSSCPKCPSPRSKLPRGGDMYQTDQGLRKGRRDGVGEDSDAVHEGGGEGEEKHQKRGKRGFSIRAWIPVPVSLFANKETCTFRVEARVWIENPFGPGGIHGKFGRYGVRWDVGFFDDEPRPSAEVVCTGRMLEASAEVTVSHLHSTREMV